MWFDLLPTGSGNTNAVLFDSLPGRAVVTWNQVQEFARASNNTFQMQLLSNGQIIFVYNTADVIRHGILVGVSPGGGASDPGPVHFTSLTTPLNTGTQGTVYETFDNGSSVPVNPFNLAGRSITFTPNGQGGWLVVDPPPLAQLLLTDGEVRTLEGPLLSATNDPQLFLGGILLVDNGQLIAQDSGPLVSLTGGPHHLGIFPGSAIFDLRGNATAIDAETGLEVGTQQPLVHAGELVRLDNAVASGEQLVRIDRALLEATAPLLNMLNGSTMGSNNDLVNLTQHAKMTANLLPGDALVRLNASTLTVNHGSLVNVANSSVFNLTGNLVSLANGSFLNILNGGLLNVSGNSVANITGSLVSFLGAGNSLTINNSFAPTAVINGIPVFTSGGATISITNPTPITGTGAQNIHGSLIIAQGAGTRVTVR
jgi:hypothetical protein